MNVPIFGESPTVKLVDPRLDPDEVERARRERAAELDGDIFRPVPVSQLCGEYPTLRQPVVEGILRRGETCNIIAAPKVGKSYLGCGLAYSVATGRPWLSYDTTRGRVLIIDNELHNETLASRLDAIAFAMQIPHADRDMVEVVSLRGRNMPVNAIGIRLQVEPSRYSLVIIDALYRTLPEGTSENDNAAMMRIYNEIDAFAARWNAAIAVVHHSSKGAQGEKTVTDVGAGAGSISRAADTHIAIRPHEENGLCVLEAVTRSWKSPEPVSIKYEYPIWTAVTTNPLVKQPTRRRADEQSKQDQADREYLLSLIPNRGLVQNTIITNSGFGSNKCLRLLGQLKKAGNVDLKHKRKRGGKQKFKIWTRTIPETHTESLPNQN
jgi:hypothetical protein